MEGKWNIVMKALIFTRKIQTRDSFSRECTWQQQKGQENNQRKTSQVNLSMALRIKEFPETRAKRGLRCSKIRVIYFLPSLCPK